MKTAACMLVLLAGLATAPAVGPAQAAEAAVAGEDADRRVLQLVNEARSRSRRCGLKRYGAVPALAPSAALRRVALAHAREMAAEGTLSHTGRNGSTPAERVTRAGYAWRYTGENIASGQPTADIVVAGWLKSPRHCANIMDADFTELGVAHATEPRAAGRIFWVQVFGTPRS